MPRKETKPLTVQQQTFIDHYIIDPNAVAAYRKAFPGCTYGTAGVEGHKLLKNPKVKAELAAARKSQQARTQITADKVLRELGRIAFSDAISLVNDNGNFLPLEKIPLELRRAIKSIKQTAQGVEYRFWDKNAALNKLCEHLGLLKEGSLEAIIAALPGGFAEAIRQHLAKSVHADGDPQPVPHEKQPE